MFILKIETLLEQLLTAAGSDLQITSREQKDGTWQAFIEGDKANVGTGATPYEAIGDYTQKVLGQPVDADSPGSGAKGLEITVAATADDATIEVKK